MNTPRTFFYDAYQPLAEKCSQLCPSFLVTCFLADVPFLFNPTCKDFLPVLLICLSPDHLGQFFPNFFHQLRYAYVALNTLRHTISCLRVKFTFKVTCIHSRMYTCVCLWHCSYVVACDRSPYGFLFLGLGKDEV